MVRVKESVTVRMSVTVRKQYFRMDARVGIRVGVRTSSTYN